MNSTMYYNNVVNSFDEYEQAVRACKNENKSWSVILDYHAHCMNLLNYLINLENSALYFDAFVNFRDELIELTKIIENRIDQVTINGVTITRVTNPICEQFPHLNEDYIPVSKKVKLTPIELRIKNTLITPNSRGLCDIAGLKTVKSLLKEAVLLPIQFPQLFSGSRKPWNKALLYGPPGTGKTQLAHSIAAEICAQFYHVSSADLLSRFVGESEKAIKTLFQSCQQSSENCIIFFDEIDGLCRKRSSKEEEYVRRVKTELLTQLSEMDRNTTSTLFFLAATNCPWDLDSAFIRRFKRRIYIPLPDRETRFEILKLNTKSSDIFISSEKWDEVVNKTEGWSGSDISDLVNCAMYRPLKDLDDAKFWVLTTENKYMPVKRSEPMSFAKNINDIPQHKITVRSVEIGDFFIALQTVTKTVSMDHLKRYEQFNASFGFLKHNLQT